MWEISQNSHKAQEKDIAKEKTGSALYSKKQTVHKDNLLTIQCMICGVVIIVVYLLRLMNSTFYDEIEIKFNNALESGVNFSSETPILRFIDNSVNEARQAALNFTNGLENNIGGDISANSSINDFITSNSSENIVESTEIANNESNSNNANSTSDGWQANNFTDIGGFTNYNLDDIADKVDLNEYTLNSRLIQPVYGVLTSKFGVRQNPFTGENEFHMGVDIAAVQGANVVSSLDGQVIETGYTQQRGNYIIVHHEQGLQTLYQHLSSGFVRIGQIVLQGQVIGTVGSTGYSTGPHLHFELLLNRKCVDPINQFPELEKTYNLWVTE